MISVKKFGELPKGKIAHLYTLSNTKGMQVSITNFGGIITHLKVPDRNGVIGDVVLGFDNLSDYLKPHPYFGAIIGRSANRISKGLFLLEGQNVQLSQNEKNNHLHGGYRGFDKVLWEANVVDNTLILKYLSVDGEEGYPGNLTCEVAFILNEQNELSIEYTCETDQPTIVNLTHHDYFNLKDAGKNSILEHELTIFADTFTPTNDLFIPTGSMASLDNHFADFRISKPIGEQLKKSELKYGFNHNYILGKLNSDDRLNHAVNLYEPENGRLMEIWTTQAAIQFYTAGYLEDGLIGKGNTSYKPFHGLCLEGQYFPDTPNHSHFPSTVLRPNEIYSEVYCMKFKTR